jgi:hypothetical protein
MTRASCLITAACMALALSACGPDSPPETSVDQKTEQFNELMKRPDIDQAVARYEEMYAKVRDQLSAVVPTLKWERTDELSSSGCAREFAAVDAGARQFDAVERGLPNWTAAGRIPDTQWTPTLSAVVNIARTYGFDSGPVVVKDQPADHYVTSRDPYGAEITFGTAVNTILTVRTGCHLTAEAKKRGIPAPTPTY